VFKRLSCEPDYVKMNHSDAFTHKPATWGMVDDQNRSTSMTGKLRVGGLQRQGDLQVQPQQYLDYVAEHTEPWSYMKFTYLKPRLEWLCGSRTPAFTPLLRWRV